jgi:hypothetical protein
MMTNLVTLIQNAERDAAATRRPATGRFIPRNHALMTGAHALWKRLTRRGFRSEAPMSSVSVRGVDFRAGRSSSV